MPINSNNDAANRALTFVWWSQLNWFPKRSGSPEGKYSEMSCCSWIVLPEITSSSSIPRCCQPQYNIWPFCIILSCEETEGLSSKSYNCFWEMFLSHPQPSKNKNSNISIVGIPLCLCLQQKLWNSQISMSVDERESWKQKHNLTEKDWATFLWQCWIKHYFPVCIDQRGTETKRCCFDLYLYLCSVIYNVLFCLWLEHMQYYFSSESVKVNMTHCTCIV